MARIVTRSPLGLYIEWWITRVQGCEDVEVRRLAPAADPPGPARKMVLPPEVVRAIALEAVRK